ncbi:MAG: hypothetical protein LM587_01955 [Candidatus Aenigmarchaeota archaeon]|nr:hypothetical protein [Candidatus Aenigmarchaeota archaeon]
MKRESITRISLMLSSIALLISIFSLVAIYGLFIELKNLEAYIVRPQAALSPSTAIFPTTIIGRFILATSSSIIAAIVSIALLIVLIIIIKKS